MADKLVSRLKGNRLRSISAKPSRFLIVGRNDGYSAPPPSFAGYILQENGAVVLAENGAKMIIE